MWFPVRSKSTRRDGVAKEKGLFGVCLDNWWNRLRLFPENCMWFWKKMHVEMLILPFFLYFDQGRRSCPRASCIVYRRPLNQHLTVLWHSRHRTAASFLSYFILVVGSHIFLLRMHQLHGRVSHSTSWVEEKSGPTNSPKLASDLSQITLHFSWDSNADSRDTFHEKII